MQPDYNTTLNLPKTEFSMRANLPQREPELLAKQQQDNFYDTLIKHNEGKPMYILHDGPPYANGDIHLGHALNKVLKDIIVRYKNMAGFCAPYIPGWDTHGLPIERQVIKKYGPVKGDTVEFREHCREFALKYIDTQKEQFKRLGIIGRFDKPYLTLNPEFEAKQIEIFGKMAEKGYIYKGLKPVYWCPNDATALAEAEIEYADDKCDSIYVKFNVSDDKGKLAAYGVDKSSTYFVIWTTTTWTLPGNLAICLGPDFEYNIVSANGENYIMAKELTENSLKAAGITEYSIVAEGIKGSEFEYMTAKHPFLDRESLVIVGDHVTLESGTGCVHTAPGHGMEDFMVCKNYPEIGIVVPVDARGKLTEEAGQFAGLKTAEANPVIAAHLKEIGALFAIEEIVHPYPHCWRCHSPIIYRATEQWFCSVEAFKDKAMEAISDVEWIPKWGEERIRSMVSDRADWCISRQRIWGVPIPIFYCEKCGKEHIDSASIAAVSALFAEKGSDAWYYTDAADILPKGTKCSECGHEIFTKETDIMDVWFDSGSSYASVLSEENGVSYPADLYLEGNDQYRGWFQSSLLTSVATMGTAPYRAVLTHGMIIDLEGRKMSKSLGNGISPQDIIKEYGADILRLWISSADYRNDVKISKEILKQLAEVYRKIRNTERFILGNLYDFDPNKDQVAFDELTELDKWACYALDALIEKTSKAYDAFDFHVIYHAIYSFCVVDMSSFYLDIIKDRLYVEKADSLSRRAAQTVIYKVLNAIVKLIAPIIPFTSEEAWSHIVHSEGDNEKSVFFNDFPKAEGLVASEEFAAKWNEIIAVRNDVQKALELARAEKKIGASLEANVTVYVSNEEKAILDDVDNLAQLFIVSGVKLETEAAPAGIFKGENAGVSVVVEKAAGEKCQRCWGYTGDIGASAEHPTLCKRCASILE